MTTRRQAQPLTVRTESMTGRTEAMTLSLSDYRDRRAEPRRAGLMRAEDVADLARCPALDRAIAAVRRA